MDGPGELAPGAGRGTEPLGLREATWPFVEVASSLRMLLDAEADINMGRPGFSPLLLACLWGNTEVCRFLLQQGALKDPLNDTGETPLWIAAQDGNLDITRLLLSFRADQQLGRHQGWLNLRNFADPSGASPLWVACCEGHRHIARVLLKAGADKARLRLLDPDPLRSTCLVCGAPRFVELRLRGLWDQSLGRIWRTTRARRRSGWPAIMAPCGS